MKKLLIASFLILFFGCDYYDQDILPPATQIGANILGCKINGQPFAATSKYRSNTFFTSYGVDADYTNDSTLIISATTGDGDGIRNNQKSMYFKFKYDGGVGKYTDIENVVKGTNSYVQITRFSDSIVSGYFEITLRYTYVSKWEGEKPIKYDNIIKRYTEGRFDIEL